MIHVSLVRKTWITNRAVKAPLDDTPVRSEAAPLHLVDPRTQAANQARLAKNEPAPGWRICSRCGELKMRSEFAIKVRNTGQLKSACNPCNRKYQQERYLSSERIKRLSPGAALHPRRQ